MKQLSFNTIYQDAPCDRVNRLLRFRSAYQIQHRLIDNIEWSYILSGTGTRTILILGGLPGTIEAAHSEMMELERHLIMETIETKRSRGDRASI
jgi:hypothetical protein